MGDDTGIEWTHISLPDGRVFRGASWNPIAAFDRATGKRGWFCVRVSQGCKHCYAATLNKRLGTGHDYAANYLDQVRFDLVNLDQPLRWTQPRGIFVNSMTDLFGEFVTDEMIDAVFAVMALAPNHIFQVLTKRPARMLAYFQRPDLYEWVLSKAYHLRVKRPALTGIPISDPARFPLPNLWLGVSVEDQAAADERIPLLLRTPAAVRWLSCEPLLGPVDLDGPGIDDLHALGCGNPGCSCGDRGIDWVVVGGESGPGARAMHPDWARSLRDQCVSGGVPYFFKQWGEWMPVEPAPQAAFGDVPVPTEAEPWQIRRVGKKAAGRLLDGREWSQYPR